MFIILEIIPLFAEKQQQRVIIRKASESLESKERKQRVIVKLG
jgi:hypothetical protein